MWCWGRNDRGQLGLGDVDDRDKPERVGLESDWLQVGVGESISCGIRSTDQLFCWGLDGNNESNTVPVHELGSYKSLAVGHEGWCAINTADDKLTCRRSGDPAPVAELFAQTAVAVTVQHTTTCAITPGHDLFCWGENQQNQVGNNDNAINPTADAPFQVPGKFAQVKLGEDHTCALGDDGRLSCWGNCGSGQTGRLGGCAAPALVDDQTYVSFSAGAGHTCAISPDGKLHCFGSNGSGQLGTLGGRAQSMPATLEGFDGWTAVAAGQFSTCALRGPDGEAWCWGTNLVGQLGDGGGGEVLTPVQTDPGPFQRVFMGDQNGCAIHQDGSLWCWGANAFGQLGDNTTLERRRPLQISDDHDWASVAIGRTSACGTRTDGTLWCWGDNTDRQLGIGGNREVHVPTQVGDQTGWTEVAVDLTNACGIQNGALFCWGANMSSMPESTNRMASSLDGCNTHFAWLEATGAISQFTPQQPASIDATFADFTSLEAGADHVCGLRNGGELWCEGTNVRGQLGIPFAMQSTTMWTREQSMGLWSKVSAGDQATCAIGVDGHLGCTGDVLLVAQGPNGNTEDQFAAVGTDTWLDVSVGGSDACGVTSAGALLCWGPGLSSGRGDGKGGHERPTRVAPP